MWTIGSVLQWTTGHFQDKGIETARLDAEVLLAYTLKKKRIELYMNYEQPLLEEERAFYRECVRKRSARMPVAYITGAKEFYGLNMLVNENVLVPRSETELLVEQVLICIKDKEKASVVEIGTGSGALITAILYKAQNTEAVALDISQEALSVAQRNADEHGVKDRVRFLKSDIFSALEQEKYDVIISNPPYLTDSEMNDRQPEVRYEPAIALHGGEDGLDFYRRILEDARDYLKTDGLLFFEIGALQAQAIRNIAMEKPFWQVERVIKDYAALDRIVILKKTSGH